jgi:hypothetical protein
MKKHFALHERFAGFDYGDLPNSELRRIRDLPESVARSCWRAWVSEQYDHLAEIPACARARPLAKLALDWDDKVAGGRAIRDLLPKQIETKIPVVHFWSPLYAVVTDLEIFLRRWDDFWYPSDDNSALIVLRVLLRLEFVEERVALHTLGRPIDRARDGAVRRSLLRS